MEKYLFIAEKPSLMRDVQACYRKHKSEIQSKVGEMDFIALAGHVCRQSEPNSYDEWADKSWDSVDYPMIPTSWKVEPIEDNYKKKLLNEIKSSINNYDGVVVGTDSDVEGYGIYYLMEMYLGLQNKKALRFMEHSLADAEILESLLTMTDFHTDTSHIRFTQSYIIRSRADWLYGMNCTRMVSVKQNEIMTIGRVKPPTIKLVYDNSMAIANFASKKYYQVEADYGDFKSSLLDKDNTIAQYDDKSKIGTYPLEGVVKNLTTEQKTEHAPKLFDLPSLQAEAGQKFGYSPQKTLELAQSLYEKHKVLSYPRTQCRYLSKERAKDFPMMLSHINVFDDLAPYVEKITDKDIQTVQHDNQVVNDVEVQKESHDAILPTSERPQLDKLTKDEQNILKMVYTRLLAQFLPKGVDNKTQLIITHGDGDFIAKGKTTVDQGWRVLYTESKDKSLPTLQKGDSITAKKIEPVEKKTTPPKRLNQATLLSAMTNIANQIEDKDLRKSLAESKGIGTPATRATIIADILRRGYIEEKKDGLYITPLGIQYINAIQHLDIVSPVFAAVMDTEIKKVQRGEADYESTYNNVINGLKDMCKQIEKMETRRDTIETKCPICGGTIIDGRYKYECEKGDFSVSKSVCGQTINESLLKDLIAGKSSNVMKFKKKDGTTFEARLAMQDYKLGFNFANESTNCSCPKCGEKLTKGRYEYVCPNNDYKIARYVGQKEITESILADLLKGKTTQPYTLKNKEGKTFKARIKIVDDKLSLDFFSGIKCPVCGADTVRITEKGMFCACEKLKVFRTVASRNLTDKELETLATKGELKNLDGFVSKAGKPFSATLVLNNGSTEFKFENNASGGDGVLDSPCPVCGQQTVKMNKNGAFCECGLKIFRTVAGHTLTDAELKDLIVKGQTKTINGFKSKNGKEFSASIILNDGKTEFKFSN